MSAPGWVPAQHGAWAMLVVPYVVGLVLASGHRGLGWGDVTLGVTWLFGYFAYNAVVLLLKSPAKRRARFHLPAGVYAAAAAASGTATLVLLGPGLLWWALVYAPLLGAALWLAASKRERSLASGVATVLASCGLMGVLRETTDAALAPVEAAVMSAVTAYFTGTVFHVKSLIRQRRNPSSARRSAAYHTVLTLAAAGAVAAGWLPWPWLPWAAALLARGLWLTRDQRTPLLIGVVEIVASSWLLALAVLTLT